MYMCRCTKTRTNTSLLGARRDNRAPRQAAPKITETPTRSRLRLSRVRRKRIASHHIFLATGLGEAKCKMRNNGGNGQNRNRIMSYVAKLHAFSRENWAYLDHFEAHNLLFSGHSLQYKVIFASRYFLWAAVRCSEQNLFSAKGPTLGHKSWAVKLER